MWLILGCAHGAAINFYLGWILIDVLRERVIRGSEEKARGLEKETQFVAYIVPFVVLFSFQLANQWKLLEEAVGLACT